MEHFNKEVSQAQQLIRFINLTQESASFVVVIREFYSYILLCQMTIVWLSLQHPSQCSLFM